MYESNSHKSKEDTKSQEKVVHKVVTGKARSVKRSGSRTLLDRFLSDDLGSIKTYLVSEVLIPNIKKMVDEAVTNGIGMLLYGEAGRSNRKNSASSKVSYSRYYDNDRNRSEDRSRQRGYQHNDIIIDNRGEAEEIVSAMEDLLERYGTVTVSDLHELAGITGVYTDNNYGWTDLRSAKVVGTRDGYLIKLPRAVPLN